MIVSLVEILEEKGFVSNDEWEKRTTEKLKEVEDLIKFEDLEGDG